jgi:3-polyprenyl-4-hydroxybenzoate decarboxylase
MKNFCFLFVVCLFAAVASAQVAGGSISSESHMLVIPGHPRQATQMAMATPHNLMERSGSFSLKGERPLWELMPEPTVVPLGDSARALRKDHAAAKKAKVVWTN